MKKNKHVRKKGYKTTMIVCHKCGNIARYNELYKADVQIGPDITTYIFQSSDERLKFLEELYATSALKSGWCDFNIVLRCEND